MPVVLSFALWAVRYEHVEQLAQVPRCTDRAWYRCRAVRCAAFLREHCGLPGTKASKKQPCRGLTPVYVCVCVCVCVCGTQKLVMDAARDVSRQGEPPYLRHFSAQDEARHSATHLTRKLTAHHVTGEGDTHHALHENEAGGHRHGEHNDCGQRVLHGVEVSAFPRGTRHVVVDMSAVSSVDYSAMHMLADIPVDLARAGLSNVKVRPEQFAVAQRYEWHADGASHIVVFARCGYAMYEGRCETVSEPFYGGYSTRRSMCTPGDSTLHTRQ